MFLQETLDRNDELVERAEFVRPILGDRKAIDSRPASPLCEDTHLIERLRSGDDTAFEEIVRKLGGRLLATARHYLRSEDDACDTLQDAFLCAFKSIGKFKGDSQLSTWLYRIVVNSAIMQLRAKRHRPEVQEVLIDDLLPRFDPTGSWLDECDRMVPLHISCEVSETKLIVRRCIESLPEAYRVVLILRDIDEFDTEEVATFTNSTPNNVKVRLHRARQALKVLIEREQIL